MFRVSALTIQSSDSFSISAEIFILLVNSHKIITFNFALSFQIKTDFRNFKRYVGLYVMRYLGNTVLNSSFELMLLN